MSGYFPRVSLRTVVGDFLFLLVGTILMITVGAWLEACIGEAPLARRQHGMKASFATGRRGMDVSGIAGL
jgi:hypothetical protein